VVLQDESREADVLVGVPDVHVNGTLLAQPALHQPALPHRQVCLHGGAHRGFPDHARVMVEVHPVAAVPGDVVHHFEPDRILRSLAHKVVPVREAFRGHMQDCVSEPAFHGGCCGGTL
jgi:hypothetical protein